MSRLTKPAMTSSVLVQAPNCALSCGVDSCRALPLHSCFLEVQCHRLNVLIIGSCLSVENNLTHIHFQLFIHTVEQTASTSHGGRLSSQPTLLWFYTSFCTYKGFTSGNFSLPSQTWKVSWGYPPTTAL